MQSYQLFDNKLDMAEQAMVYYKIGMVLGVDFDFFETQITFNPSGLTMVTDALDRGVVERVQTAKSFIIQFRGY